MKYPKMLSEYSNQNKARVLLTLEDIFKTIEQIEQWNSPMTSIADAKGILIQNGKKFIRK